MKESVLKILYVSKKDLVYYLEIRCNVVATQITLAFFVVSVFLEQQKHLMVTVLYPPALLPA